MGKDSLPLVWGTDGLTYLRPGLWYRELLANKEAYKDCFVPSFTRVKNLGSKYMHEYCQFIVEDRSTGERARVYAERADEKYIDVITLGRDEKAPREWDELPLPLTSLVFENKAEQPSLYDVANILSSANVIGGNYNLFDKNCFWFAFTTFETLRLAFPGTLKNWLWVNPGGKGGGSWGDAWGWGFPTMFKYFFKPSAKEFEKERTDKMSFLEPADYRERITPESFVAELGSHLLEPQSVQAYSSWVKTLGVDIDKDGLHDLLNTVGAKVKELDQQGSIAWTREFDSAVRDMTSKIGSDPDAARYLEIYDAQPKTGYVDIDVGSMHPMDEAKKTLDGVNGEPVANPQRQNLLVRDNMDKKLAKALRTVVGATLVESGFAKN